MKTTTQTISRINAWQAGYVMAACYLFGFLLFMPLAFLTASFNRSPGEAFAGYLMFAVFYVIFGLLFTALSAWIYNVVSSIWTGGLTIEVTAFDHEAYAANGYSSYP